MARRHAIAPLAGLTLALALAACGDGADAGGGAAPSVAPAQDRVVVTAETAAEPFSLAAGRYKFGWEAPDCRGVSFAMTGAGQGFSYDKTSALPRFSAIVSNVPADTYTLTQSDAGCTSWTVRLDRIGS